MHRHRHFVLSTAAAAAIFTLAASQAHAVFRHWTGTASTDWSNGTNWGGPGGFAPTQDLTTDVAYFDTVTSLDPTITNSTEVAATQFITSHTISGVAGQTLTLGTFMASGITFSAQASGTAVATFDVPVVAGTVNFDVVADNTSTITFNGGLSGTTLNISNALSGGGSQVNINSPASFSGALNVNGSTNVYLAANQQILGNYNINSGGISIDSASALGTSNINLGTSSGGAGSLAVSSNADVAVANNFNIQSNNNFGVLTGGGTITNNGTGNLILSGPIQIGSTLSNIAQLTIGGTGNTTISGDVTTFYNSNYDAGSSIVKNGTGTLTITGNNASTWGNNEGNFAGDLIVDQGTVQLRNGNAIGVKSTINVESNGTLDLGSENQTIGSLNNFSNDTGGSVTLGSATITLNGGISGANFSGVISGTGGIVVTGDANQTFSGTNTYSGGTTITNGTLLAGSNVPRTGAGAFGNNSSTTIVVGNSQTTSGAYVGIDGDDITIAKDIQFSAGAAQTRGIFASTDNGAITGDLQLAGSDILISTNAPGGLSTSALTISGHITGTGGLVIEGSSGGVILTGNAAGENATRNITINSANLLIQDNTAAGTTPILLGTAVSDANGWAPGLYTIAGVTVARDITIGSSQTTIGGFGDFNSTFSGNISIGNGFGLQLYSETTTAGNAVTLSGTISGSGSVNMIGTGTAVLGGNNMYTQGTFIEGGTLRVSADANLGVVPGSVKAANIELVDDGYTDVVTLGIDSSFTLNSNRGITVASSTVGAIDVASGANLIYGGVIVGGSSTTSKLEKTGAGTLSLSGASTIGGGFTVQGGTVLVGAAVPATGTTSAANSPVGREGVTLGNSSSTSTDAPTLLMNGAFNFSRALTIFNGAATPTFGNNTDNNVTFSGNIALSHAVDIYSAAVSSGNALTVSGVLSGANGITLTGPGTTVLSNTNTFTGKVNINSGILSVSTINNVGASTGSNLGKQTGANATIGIGAGTLKYTGATVITNRPISLSASGGTLDGAGTGLLTVDVTSGNAIAGTNTSFTLAGSTGGKINDPISLGTGSLTKSGAGTWTLGAANSYTGATNVTGGTLTLTSGGSITNSSAIDVSSGAIFDASAFTTFNVGASQTIKGAGNVIANINTAGAIQGTGKIIGNVSSTNSIVDRAITGNITLSGNGSLGGNAIVNGNVNLSTSGTQLAGDVKIGGTLSGSGIVGPGNSPGLLTATNLDPSSGMSFNFELTKDGAPDFSDPSNIGNDVLHLTDTSDPLTSQFTSANVVNFFIEDTALSGNSSVIMDGGLFTDSTTPGILSSLSSATINYYIETSGGAIRYNGNTYSLLNASSFSPHLSVVPESADFAGGTVDGQVTELSLTSTAVPLPTAFASGSVLLGGLYVRHARRRRRLVPGLIS
jgi:fibronectin-binding autotransporter adhesin